jgi:hypothetical protein
MRKQKRAIDDQMSDVRLALRPLEDLKSDLEMYAKRATSKEWDARREMKTRKIA